MGYVDFTYFLQKRGTKDEMMEILSRLKTWKKKIFYIFILGFVWYNPAEILRGARNKARFMSWMEQLE